MTGRVEERNPINDPILLELLFSYSYLERSNLSILEAKPPVKHSGENHRNEGLFSAFSMSSVIA